MTTAIEQRQPQVTADKLRAGSLAETADRLQADLTACINTLVEIRDEHDGAESETAAQTLREIATPVVCGRCGGDRVVACNNTRCFGGDVGRGNYWVDCPACGGQGEMGCSDCEGKGTV